MEKIAIALAIKDRPFGRALEKGLMETGKVNVAPPHEAKVLLLDEGLMGEQVEIYTGEFSGRKMILTREEGRASWTSDTPSIYRYTSAPEMVSLLKYVLGNKAKEEGGDLCRVIALISDEGGTGVSTIGVNLSRILSRRGGAIYLNLCPFSTSPREILWGESDRAGGKTWLRMLYSMSKGRRGILPALTENIEELFYIPAPHINSHADGIDLTILKNLKAEAGEQGFKYIVLDIGNHWEGNRKEILEKADKIIGINPGYDMEVEMNRRYGDRAITAVNLYKENAVEISGDRAADVSIGFSPTLGRTSLDTDLREAFEALANLVEGEKE